MKLSPLAGKAVDRSMLVDITKLVTAYYTEKPDPSIREQRVSFGTSGHRGSSFRVSFNETHILAISQAICLYRQMQKIEGPLFLGIDTHALSFPAFVTAISVFAANNIEVVLAENDEFTPTPVISHAILTYNRGRKDRFADGVVITPSHNPPDDGGYKYNPPNGGPSDTVVTSWIQNKANEFIENGLSGIKQISYEKAINASTTHRYNYREAYIADLINVVDLGIISESKISLGVDPLGGAGVHYWQQIAEKYNLNLTVVNEIVDPTFSFMTSDWDGKIRMDPSSPYAMQKLIGLKDHFKISFACDTDHDRHGIVSATSGLMPPNNYLSASIFYLFQHRPKWSQNAAVGKTLVSSQMIDRVAGSLGRKVYEVPAGFKWFVDGLFDNSLAFVGEESAGATFARIDGTVWTTDKDGIIPCLLAGEMTARMNKDPGQIYNELTEKFGKSYYDRFESPATIEQKDVLLKLRPEQISATMLGGEKIQNIYTNAPGNKAPIGGLKVNCEGGWFVVRPSGTESIYKIYVESLISEDHMKWILVDAQTIVDQILSGVPNLK